MGSVFSLISSLGLQLLNYPNLILVNIKQPIYITSHQMNLTCVRTESYIPFLILKVRYPAISYIIGFSLLLGMVIVMNSNTNGTCVHVLVKVLFLSYYNKVLHIQVSKQSSTHKTVVICI